MTRYITIYKYAIFTVTLGINLLTFFTFKWLHHQAWLMITTPLLSIASGFIVKFFNPKSPFVFGLIYGAIIGFIIIAIAIGCLVVYAIGM